LFVEELNVWNLLEDFVYFHIFSAKWRFSWFLFRLSIVSCFQILYTSEEKYDVAKHSLRYLHDNILYMYFSSSTDDED
jgi:hypothetical protein